MVAARGKVPLALPLIRQSLEGSILLRRALAKVGHFSIGIDNVLEVTPIPGQKTVRMLQRLAGKPKILNTVSVLSASGANLGSQAAEYVAGYRIHCDERF